MIELRAGIKGSAAVDLLRDLRRELDNISGTSSTPAEGLDEWRRWSARASTRARGLFSERATRSVVLGEHFAMLQGLSVSAYGQGLAPLIDAELETRSQDLARATEQIAKDMRFWGSDTLAVVLDAVVLMEAGPRIAKIRWDDLLNDKARNATFVLPIQVIEELDEHKMSKDSRLRSNAQYALKWLNQTIHSGNRKFPFPLAKMADSKATICVWVDDIDRVPLPEVDRDIIERVQQLAAFTRRAVIASLDQSMVLRARAYDVQAVLIPADSIPERANA